MISLFSMKRASKFFAAILAAGSVSVGHIGAAAPEPTPTATPAKHNADLFPEALVAKGKGIQIKRSQLDDAMVSIKSSFAARGQEMSPDEMNRIEQQVLDRLIQIQILMQKATDADKAAGKETCTKRLEAIKARAGSDEALNRQLK